MEWGKKRGGKRDRMKRKGRKCGKSEMDGKAKKVGEGRGEAGRM